MSKKGLPKTALILLAVILLAALAAGGVVLVRQELFYSEASAEAAHKEVLKNIASIKNTQEALSSIKEDTWFVVQYLCRSNGVTVFTLTPVYNYRQHGDSTMGRYMNDVDDSFVDPLFALQKMKHEIEASFSPCSELVFIANEGIWIRYHRMLARLKKFGINDEGLRHQMRSIVKKELKFSFFVRKKLRKIKQNMHAWCSGRKLLGLCRTTA